MSATMHPTHISSRQSTPLAGRPLSSAVIRGTKPALCRPGRPSLVNHRIQTIADRATGDVDPKHTVDVAEVNFSTDGSFVWEKNWYPILPLKLADSSKPYGFTLLGRDLVLWQDAEKNWRVFEDRCAHRQARLSRGRLSERDGSLMCSFHGWCFDGDGQCTRIPQAPESEHDKYANSRRGSVAAYPAQVKDGLIWVWGESSPQAWLESSMTEIDSWDEFPETHNWPISELPLGYHMMTEMFFDPSHVPIVHEGIMPGSGEDGTVPMEMKVVKSTRDGFTLISSGYLKNSADCMATIEFKAPGTCSAVYNLPYGMQSKMRGYYIPTTPGKCRIIMGFKNTRSKAAQAQGGILQKIQKLRPFLNVGFLLGILEGAIMSAVDLLLPEAWRYARRHGLRGSVKFGNQDLHIMYGMDQVLKGIEKKWKREYFLPAKADVGVLAFRNWLDKHSGGDVTWAPGAKNEEAKSLDEVFDRWNRHTKHCKYCTQTAKDLIKVASVLRKVAVACFTVSGLWLLFSGFKAKPSIAGLIVAGLAMLASGKANSALHWLKTSVPQNELPGNVNLVYRDAAI